MKREELLEKLAMEVGHFPTWPHTPNTDYPELPGSWCWQFDGAGEASIRHSEHNIITRQDWLAERERLINKPGWSKAPEWAQWLAQDEDGSWCFYKVRPSMDCDIWGEEARHDEYVEACNGCLPAGRDWRQTLEQRPDAWPETDERITHIGQNGNDGAAYSPYREGFCCVSLAGQGHAPGCKYAKPAQSSGGMKFDGEKPRMDLLLSDMPRALTEVGKVLTFGAAKYAPGNWQYVENAEERYRAAGLRHDLALSMGEQHDSETGLLHLAHEACCILFRLELALRAQEAAHADT